MPHHYEAAWALDAAAAADLNLIWPEKPGTPRGRWAEDTRTVYGPHPLLQAADEHYWKMVLDIAPSIRRLASKITSRWGVEKQEYMGAAQEWTYRAALRYDPSRGPFTRYANHWIRTGVERAHSETAFLIRLPGNVLTLRWSINKAIREIEAKGGGWTFGGVADLLGVDVEAVHVAYYGRRVLPIESAANAANDEDIEATASGREAYAMIQAIAASSLTPQRQEVVGRRFGVWGSDQPETTTEISGSMDLTRQGVDYNLKKALKEIRLKSPEDLRMFVL